MSSMEEAIESNILDDSYDALGEFISRYPRLAKFKPVFEEFADKDGNPCYKLALSSVKDVYTTFNSNLLGILIAKRIPNPEDTMYEFLAKELYKKLLVGGIIDELPDWMN